MSDLVIRKKEKYKVVVSLTTTPKRIDNILPTITSLLNQTRPPDSILLCIPTFCDRLNMHFTKMPAFLLELEKKGKVTILKTDDYGPATKFIPAWRFLKSREDDFLIWVDDDIKYSYTLVEELVKTCPDKAAIASSGFQLKLNGEHKIAWYNLECADIIEGYGGVCCRIKDMPDLDKIWSIKKPYKEMNLLEKCFWHSDDYVISRALQDSGVYTLIYNTKKHNRGMNTPLEMGLQSDALQNSTVTNGHHAAYALLEKQRTFNNLIKDLASITNS